MIGILAIDSFFLNKKLELYKQKIMMEVRDVFFILFFCNFGENYVFFSFLQNIWSSYEISRNPSSKVLVKKIPFLQIYTTKKHSFSQGST